MTFPNPPVATMRVARITQRDSSRTGAWPRLASRNFAPGCRLVTAGDGNMVSVDYMGHPRQASLGATNSKKKQGSQYRSRRRGRQHVSTYTRG
jgi:hypothetical protein